MTALFTPLAISLAVAKNLPPHIFTNAAYATPLINPNNLLVREVGHYTMRDYLGQGIPVFVLQAIILIGVFAMAL